MPMRAITTSSSSRVKAPDRTTGRLPGTGERLGLEAGVNMVTIPKGAGVGNPVAR